MTCPTFDAQLLSYQLGELADPARSALEAHLPGCPGCVRGLVALKRQLELADVAPGLRPSSAAAAKLRRAMAEAVRPPPAPWERPVSWLLAAAAAVAAMLFVCQYAHHEAVPRGISARVIKA